MIRAEKRRIQHFFHLCRFLSGESDQTGKPGSEEPDSGGNRNRSGKGKLSTHRRMGPAMPRPPVMRRFWSCAVPHSKGDYPLSVTERFGWDIRYRYMLVLGLLEFRVSLSKATKSNMTGEPFNNI